jgi:hypothetical protein
MKIVKQDENSMLLKQLNIAGIILGLIFFVVGVIVIIKPSSSSVDKSRTLGAIFAVVGLLAFVTTQRITINIDRESKKIKIIRKSLISSDNKEYNFDQVKQVEHQAIVVADRNGSSSATSQNGTHFEYSYVIVLVDGSEAVRFSDSKGISIKINGRSVGAPPSGEVGKKIAEFINVPFQIMRPALTAVEIIPKMAEVMGNKSGEDKKI